MYGLWAFNHRWSNTFTVTDLKLHSQKRKVLNNVFSDKALHSAEAFIVKHVDRWIELSINDNGETWSKPKNMSEWADYLILDILGELCFGVSLNTKEPEDNPFKDIPHSNANALQLYYPVS
jgi:cytochrome P450